MTAKIYVANWKMNVPARESIEQYIGHLKKFRVPANTHIIIAPPFPYLPLVARLIKKSRLEIAAQNVHWETEGTFTGEVSAKMLQRFGVHFVIIGHSERRRDFYETDAIINRKLRIVVHTRLTPILCIGETAAQRKRGETRKIILTQLRRALQGIRNPRVIIAYEPVWAIGTGINAQPTQVQQVHVLIRSWLTRKFTKKNTIPILYGGSAAAHNSHSFMQQPDIDGLLVGGASLSSQQFRNIIQT